MPGEEFVVTLRDVYDKVARIEDRVTAMADIPAKVADHEIRIRSLEKWRYALPISLLIAVASIVEAIRG